MASKRRRRLLPTASLVIRNAAGFTPRGRRKIAAWLARVGRHLVKEGDDYAKCFTARLSLR